MLKKIGDYYRWKQTVKPYKLISISEDKTFVTLEDMQGNKKDVSYYTFVMDWEKVP